MKMIHLNIFKSPLVEHTTGLVVHAQERRWNIRYDLKKIHTCLILTYSVSVF